MKAFLLALEITPMETHRSYPKGLPLHCTVLHWFRTEADESKVLETATGVIQTTPPIELVAGEEAWFGPSNGPQNISVNRILPTPEHLRLHYRLCAAIGTLGLEHTEPAYILNGYNPHVTKQAEGQFVEGSRHISTATYLVEARNPLAISDKLIIARIPHQ